MNVIPRFSGWLALDGAPLGGRMPHRAGSGAVPLAGGEDRPQAVLGPDVSRQASGPVTTASGRGELRECWAICAGRIDNADEVRSLLDLAANRMASDADLLLAAYGRWGTSCPRHLVGDHVLMVWDARERQLFLSRDPAQSVPLYYRVQDGLLRWSSGLQELARDAAEPWDHVYLTTFMVMGNLNWERTPHRSIQQLPGGSSLTMREGRARTWRWWEPPQAGSLRYRRVEEYREHLRALLREAVRCRLRSSLPVSITLSRGIDSAAIAATAVRLQRDGQAPCPALRAVTGSLPEYPEGDESPDARLVARQIGIEQQVVPIRPYPGDMRPALAQLAEPCGIAGNWHFWQSMQDACAAVPSGVLLTGVGGELFDCDPYYLADLARERRYHRLPREVWRWMRAGLPARVPLQLGMVGLVDARVTSWLPEERLRHYPWLRHPELCQTDFASRALPHPVVRRFHHWLLEAGRVSASVQQLLPPDGVELRHPLLDRRLLEFCYAVPLEHKLPMRDAEGQFHEKSLVRGAFAPELPPGLTKPNAATRDYSNRNLYQDWRTLKQLLRQLPAGLEEVVRVDVLREHAAAYQVDRGGKRWASLTSVLACWLYGHDSARAPEEKERTPASVC